MKLNMTTSVALTKIWVSLWITSAIFCCPSVVGSSCVPAMFVFGDSLGDAGNNNHIPHCNARANFPPYGVSHFRKPTGRFTNGRTAFDLIGANYLRLPYVPPRLKPNANFSKGINFASGGSGLLDTTGAQYHIISMSQQISQFENYSSKFSYGADEANSFLAKSLVCISIGGNDVHDHFILPTPKSTSDAQLVASMLDKFQEYITRLYRCGARKFLVFDIPAVGCAPYARYYARGLYSGKCFDPANNLSVAYNAALRRVVDDLNQKLDGLNLILLNSYNYAMNIIEHGEAFGFSNTTWACCGDGPFRVETPCGKTTPPAKYCNDTTSYFFWDGIHPTETVYKIFAREIWSGNSSVIYPFNLSTLILR